MVIKKNIATSESGFIFNPSTGDSFSANPLANEIIQSLKEGQSIQKIKASITDRYDVDIFQLEKDLDNFVLQLREANLLEY
ncbi:MAG: PqqD family protein [Chitinophagaceae bacterium]|nr:PqqD family protein [Chitinophagaceae bacterium]